MLGDQAENIPLYLQDMRELINSYPQYVSDRVLAARKIAKIPQSVSNSQLFALVNRTMTLLGKYSSKINNGNYSIKANFSKLIKGCRQFDNPFSP